LDQSHDDYSISREKIMRISIMLLLLIAFTAAAHAQINITEYMPDPAAVSDSAGEWFEITNYGPTDIDLNGYTFRDDGSDSFTISTSVMLERGVCFILGNNSDFATNGGVVVDYAYSGWYLANSGDEIIIENPSGALVNEVWYESSATGASTFLDEFGEWNTETLYQYGDGDFGTPGQGCREAAVSDEAMSFGDVKSLYR
jgi:hypothetical protein